MSAAKLELFSHNLTQLTTLSHFYIPLYPYYRKKSTFFTYFLLFLLMTAFIIPVFYNKYWWVVRISRRHTQERACFLSIHHHASIFCKFRTAKKTADLSAANSHGITHITQNYKNPVLCVYIHYIDYRNTLNM